MRPTPTPTPPRQRGLTLIELMIALVVVAILAAVALPSYRDSVRKSTRAEAQSWMLAVAARQQQFLVDRRAYAATLDAVGVSTPASVAAGYTLTLTLDAGPPPGFAISAVPKGGQVGERCGTLSINQSMAKSAAQGGCW